MSLIQMIFGCKKSPEKDMGEGRAQHSLTPHGPPTHTDQQRKDIAGDRLSLFLHLTGITSYPSMVHEHGDPTGRAAPNLGIYVPVVRYEEDASRGYKYFSWLINGCLGLQIVFAAALTALGAAGASRSAVTVFGAMNTVMAGMLIFLKGSGLSNRLEYYQAE